MAGTIQDIEDKNQYELQHVEATDAPASVVAKGADDQVFESPFAHLPTGKLVRLFWKTNLIAFFSLSGALFDGFSVNVPASISANTSFIERFGTVISSDGTKSLNATYVSAWNGMTSGVQVISVLVGAQLADRFGRKFNFYVVILCLAVGLALELTATNWIYFLMARAFCGWATGIAKATLPTYVAEIAPAGLRSTLLTLFLMWYATGQFACAVALQIIQEAGISWRHAFLSELAFFGIFIPVALLIPESPWFYANKNDHEKAKKMLRRLNGNVPGYDIELEYAIMAAEVERNRAMVEQQKSVVWIELFKGVNGRRTWISFFPIAAQQFVGVLFVFYYLSYLFSVAGINNPYSVLLASNATTLGTLILTVFVIEKVGRRILLLSTLTVVTLCNLCMGIIGTIAAKNGNNLNPLEAKIVIAAVVVWVFSYSIGVGPLGFAYVADTSTPLLRAKTTALASSLTGCFGLIFSFCTPLMISTQDAGWGMRVAYFYTPLSFLSLIATYFTIPETGKRSYEELDELFERRISTRKFASTRTSVQRADALDDKHLTA